MMIRRLSVAAIAVTLMTPLCWQGAHAADSSLLNSTAPDRQSKLEAAAKDLRRANELPDLSRGQV